MVSSTTMVASECYFPSLGPFWWTGHPFSWQWQLGWCSFLHTWPFILLLRRLLFQHLTPSFCQDVRQPFCLGPCQWSSQLITTPSRKWSKPIICFGYFCCLWFLYCPLRWERTWVNTTISGEMPLLPASKTGQAPPVSQNSCLRNVFFGWHFPRLWQLNY